MPWYRNFERSTPLSTDEGIEARSKRGAFAEHWWAERWIEALEQLMSPGRLRRGKRYARKGQVLSIEEAAEGAGVGITAEVQGSRPQPYHVEIRLQPLSEEAWEIALDALAREARFSADLLAGRMPPDVEEAFASAGAGLFPESRGDLQATCSCPDPAAICKHIAATHYLLSERFDEDPFLLFRLRGRTRAKVLKALGVRRGTNATAEEPQKGSSPPGVEAPDARAGDDAAEATAQPLGASMAEYWRAGDALKTLSMRIEPPATPLPVLRRLGPAAFLKEDPASLFGPTYTAMSEAARAAAFQEPASSEDDDVDQPGDDASRPDG